MPKMKTKDITEKYHITRQSINNWERFDGLKTKRTGTNRLIWDNESISWLDKFIKQKVNGSIPRKKPESFNIQNRRYLGSKLRLLDFIKNVTEKNTKNVKTIADIFGGTGVVANMFFQNGENVIVNDILDSNLVSYETFFGSEDIDEPKVQAYIQKMNHLPLRSNYVSDNYGDKYFSADNAKKIGEAREYIEGLTNINGRERAVLLTSLIYAMDKSANTVGHYDAYRKKMDTLAPIVFKLPDFNTNTHSTARIYHEDANRLVKNIEADMVYIDPPYNSRQYGDIYHVLENIIDWQKPKLYGKAMKPQDRSKTKSKYSTSKAPEAFDELISNINARYIMVSHNNTAHKGAGRSNAKISNDEIIKSLSKRGNVKVFSEKFQVFTTGKTTIKDHKELLYLVEVDK